MGDDEGDDGEVVDAEVGEVLANADGGIGEGLGFGDADPSASSAQGRSLGDDRGSTLRGMVVDIVGVFLFWSEWFVSF